MKNLQPFRVLFFLVIATPLLAQPAWSRGEQIFTLSFEECMSRAGAALRAEGYVNINSQANVVSGYKGVNTALIICNGTADGREWVNIVVATITNDAGIPGQERVNLQTRMNGQTPPSNVNSGQTVDWSKDASEYRGKIGQRFTFGCPANGYVGARLYGTDVYTDDSSICTAGVHAGAISYVSGGNVTIEIREGQQAYLSTTRNGITSSGWGAWGGSFAVIR